MPLGTNLLCFLGPRGGSTLWKLGLPPVRSDGAGNTRCKALLRPLKPSDCKLDNVT